VLGEGWAGVDLDAVRDAASGALTPEAQAIVNALNSYVEVSPSGDGVKTFVKAWHGKNHARKGLEAYAGARYFTVTGQHVDGTPTEPQDRQAEFDALVAKEFGEVREAEHRTRGQKTTQLAATRRLDSGGRDNGLTRLAGKLRRQGLDEDAIAEALWRHNLKYCTPPLERCDIDRIARSIGSKASGDEEFVVYRSGPRTGQVVADSQHNIRLALSKLGLTFRYNGFANASLVRSESSDRPLDDALLHRAWLQTDEAFGFRPPIEFFQIVVADLARRDTFHPVRDYLDGLTWDRTPRLDTWLTTYGGADDTAYTRAVGALFLLAAVRRVRAPGCKFDELLILESEQGRLKSQALRALCPDEAWFSDDLPLGVAAKQVIEATAGKWIIEASELHGYSNAEVERLKGTLARQVDGPVRLAYGRLSVEVPRQFVMAGTTNRLTDYLRDSTGNRRFWPVRITQFDLAALKQDRDQLWAEASEREALGESIRLPQDLWAAAGVQQDARREVDPWEELLDDRVDFTRDAILVEEIWRALGDAASQRKTNDAGRISRIVQRHGFVRKKKVDVVAVGRGTPQRIGRQWAWLKGDADPVSIETQAHLAFDEAE
jgi:hypothetical protein